MEVILLQDVEKVGLRGEVVDVARGYARNFLLPRRLAENATPARVAELRTRRRRAREARGADGRAGAGDRRAPRQDRAALRGEGRPDRLALRLGHAVGHRRRDLAYPQGARRPAQDRHRPAQAHRSLLDPDRALRGRRGRGEDAGRPRGRRASARGGARGDRGRRGRGRGGRGGSRGGRSGRARGGGDRRSPRCSPRRKSKPRRKPEPRGTRTSTSKRPRRPMRPHRSQLDEDEPPPAAA